MISLERLPAIPTFSVLLLLVQSYSIAQSDCTFRQGREFQAGDRPVSVVTADFNQDGFEDFATVNSDSVDFIFLFLNDGTGQFNGSLVDTPNQNFNFFLVAEDIDGDSDVDLTLVTFGRVLFYLNDGNGMFSDATVAPITSGTISSLKYRDLDGDGDSEMIYLDRTFEEIVVLANNGNGVFSVLQTIISCFI